jgi:hypothetical protein
MNVRANPATQLVPFHTTATVTTEKPFNFHDASTTTLRQVSQILNSIQFYFQTANMLLKAKNFALKVKYLLKFEFYSSFRTKPLN